MNSTAVLVVVLILALVILVGNTLLAVAFLRGRKKNSTSFTRTENKAIDELHARVQGLSRKSK